VMVGDETHVCRCLRQVVANLESRIVTWQNWPEQVTKNDTCAWTPNEFDSRQV